MLTVHGSGGHGRVVAEAWRGPVKFTDDADGTRPDPDVPFIVGIGDNRVRAAMGGTALVQHRFCHVASDVILGRGTFVGAGAVLNPGVWIGNGVIVNTRAVVDHDCIVHDFAHIAPGAVLCGNVVVGQGAFVGANSVVKQGLTIGDWAVVGCGSVVVEDVPPNEKWFGNPARARQGGGGRESNMP